MKKRFSKKVKSKIFHCNFFSKNRKGIVTDYLPWILIAIALLALIMVSIFVLREKGISLIDKIKDLFRI